MERLQLMERALLVGGRTEELPDGQSLAEAPALAGSDDGRSVDQGNEEVASPAASEIRQR
jgi:hypothetical protein